MEVEGEEVGAGDEDETMDEADGEGGDVGAAGEEAEGHDGVFGEFPFVEEEENNCEEAEDYEAEDGGGGPRVGDATVLKAEEEHDGTAGDGDDAEPVNGLEAGENSGFGCFDVEEEEDYYEGEAIEGDCGVLSFYEL